MVLSNVSVINRDSETADDHNYEIFETEKCNPMYDHIKRSWAPCQKQWTAPVGDYELKQFAASLPSTDATQQEADSETALNTPPLSSSLTAVETGTSSEEQKRKLRDTYEDNDTYVIVQSSQMDEDSVTYVNVQPSQMDEDSVTYVNVQSSQMAGCD